MTDQAEPQSVTDRIASKFGFPSAKAPVEAAPSQDGGEDSAGSAESDLFELNFDGEAFRVPSKLKDAFMRQEDYTRKTQELADQRRSVEHSRELAQTKQLEAVFADSVASETKELAIIDAYLQQATKVDWAQMSTEQILRHKVEVDAIKERRDSLKSDIDAKRSRFSDEVNAKLKELRGKSRELVSKKINGFSEETEATLRKYAVAEGLSELEVDNVLLDPRSAQLIWKAMQFDQVKAGTTKAAEAATKADRVLKPGGAGESQSAKNVANMNFAKAMKAAGHNSSAKAKVIEDRLAGVFGR